MSNETKKRLMLSKWRDDQDTGRDRDDYAGQLETVLLDVKYWLHDGLVMNRLVSDPRALLRKVEDVI